MQSRSISYITCHNLKLFAPGAMHKFLQGKLTMCARKHIRRSDIEVVRPRQRPWRNMDQVNNSYYYLGQTRHFNL